MVLEAEENECESDRLAGRGQKEKTNWRGKRAMEIERQKSISFKLHSLPDPDVLSVFMSSSVMSPSPFPLILPLFYFSASLNALSLFFSATCLLPLKPSLTSLRLHPVISSPSLLIYLCHWLCEWLQWPFYRGGIRQRGREEIVKLSWRSFPSYKQPSRGQAGYSNILQVPIIWAHSPANWVFFPSPLQDKQT